MFSQTLTPTPAIAPLGPDAYPRLRFDKGSIKTEPNGCWTWIGKEIDISPALYVHGLLNDPLTRGQTLVQTCKTNGCVNPDHQRVRTSAQSSWQSWGLRDDLLPWKPKKVKDKPKEKLRAPAPVIDEPEIEVDEPVVEVDPIVAVKVAPIPAPVPEPKQAAVPTPKPLAVDRLATVLWEEHLATKRIPPPAAPVEVKAQPKPRTTPKPQKVAQPQLPRPLATVCKRGHALTPENLYFCAGGKRRECLKCKRMRDGSKSVA